MRLEVAKPVLDSGDMPAPAVIITPLYLVEGIVLLQVRHLVEQTVYIGHHRPIIEHL